MSIMLILMIRMSWTIAITTSDHVLSHRFITENVNCKQTLLESGCGEVMSSEFAFRMSKLSSLKAIRSVGCQLSSVNTYTGKSHTLSTRPIQYNRAWHS